MVNKVENIEEELPPLPSLVYLNLRTNKLSKHDSKNAEGEEVKGDLNRLFGAFPTLVDLNVINCPIELQASSIEIMIGKVLAKNHHVKRFCKVEITD